MATGRSCRVEELGSTLKLCGHKSKVKVAPSLHFWGDGNGIFLEPSHPLLTGTKQGVSRFYFFRATAAMVRMLARASASAAKVIRT